VQLPESDVNASPTKEIDLLGKNMNENSEARFLVEIDGNPRAVYDDIAKAKHEGLSLANVVSSVKITSVGPGGAPSTAWYWDYAISNWVYVQNAVFAEAGRKDE
jgi:hypothetical protein